MRSRVALLALALAVASAETPRTRRVFRAALDGKPDFSGIWQSLSGADYGLEPHLRQ